MQFKSWIGIPGFVLTLGLLFSASLQAAPVMVTRLRISGSVRRVNLSTSALLMLGMKTMAWPWAFATDFSKALPTMMIHWMDRNGTGGFCVSLPR